MSDSLPNGLLDCRRQFPSLAMQIEDRPAVFLDGPAGTQVPQRVIDAMSSYLIECNANHGGLFATSVESDRRLATAHQTYASFVGCDDADEIAFGQNMTSLTFAFSRALANEWTSGDEIVVTQLDHDANVTPWVMAARDRGVEVRIVGIRSEDCTLDIEAFHASLNQNTRLVALGAASNASGSINPLKELIAAAHHHQAKVFVDAVHFAPHRLIDVKEWGADLVAFSSYKFFGPHLGVLWGRREILESLNAYKVRPASDHLPEKWMTGTQSHESIMGAREAVEYLADLGRTASGNGGLDTRAALREAFDAIQSYEQSLCSRLLQGLERIPGIRVWGISELDRLDERMPTVSITHERVTTTDLALRLGEAGIFVWHGNYYALQLTEALGLEPEGMIRLGLAHYNTAEEVDRLCETLEEIVVANRV